VSDPSANTLTADWRKLLRPTGTLRAMLAGFATIAGLTLLVRAAGFAKDAAVAGHFGVAAELDAFLLAFGLHTFVAGMLASGIPSAMLPVHSELRHRVGEDVADRLALQSALVHGVSLALGAAVMILASGPIVSVMGRGFNAETRALTERLLLELSPFLCCYGMTSHLGMWLRSKKNFVVAAASPILTPAAVIVFLLLAGSDVTIDAMVYATVTGSALHLLVMAVAVTQRLPARSSGWWSTLRAWESEHRTVFQSAGPYLIAGLVMGATVVVDQAMAGWLAEGSVAVLSFSDKICGIVLALTAMAASEALFPFFADLVAKQEWSRLRHQIMQTLVIVAVVSIPLTLVMSWQAPWIVKTLFERGEFGADDTARVAHVLRFAALQVPFYITGVLISRVVPEHHSQCTADAIHGGRRHRVVHRLCVLDLCTRHDGVGLSHHQATH
jgi:putative peptidoglycan lipid II flippase